MLKHVFLKANHVLVFEFLYKKKLSLLILEKREFL